MYISAKITPGPPGNMLSTDVWLEDYQEKDIVNFAF